MSLSTNNCVYSFIALNKKVCKYSSVTNYKPNKIASISSGLPPDMTSSTVSTSRRRFRISWNMSRSMPWSPTINLPSINIYPCKSYITPTFSFQIFLPFCTVPGQWASWETRWNDMMRLPLLPHLIKDERRILINHRFLKRLLFFGSFLITVKWELCGPLL